VEIEELAEFGVKDFSDVHVFGLVVFFLGVVLAEELLTEQLEVFHIAIGDFDEVPFPLVESVGKLLDEILFGLEILLRN
jgi:hypothetical protein